MAAAQATPISPKSEEFGEIVYLLQVTFIDRTAATGSIE